MAIAKTKTLKKATCTDCGAEVNKISSGKLYDKFGCGHCREIKKKHHELGIAYIMFAEISAADLKLKIWDIFRKDVQIKIEIASADGETVHALAE